MVFEDERLSYGELDARSSQLAHHLRALGVGPEVVVGLCIERSLAMLVGLLGILKAGGAYLPLDPDYPPERLAFMLADAGAPVLLTRTALRAHLPAHDTRIDAAHIVCLDADWPAIARQPTTAPVTGLAPQHPAYVIYTSGSTGTPKGVAVYPSECRQLVGRADGGLSDAAWRSRAWDRVDRFRCFDRTKAPAVAARCLRGADGQPRHARAVGVLGFDIPSCSELPRHDAFAPCGDHRDRPLRYSASSDGPRGRRSITVSLSFVT